MKCFVMLASSMLVLASAEAAAQTDNDGQVSDVVVTATKRQTTLQDTPVAVTVTDA